MDVMLADAYFIFQWNPVESVHFSVSLLLLVTHILAWAVEAVDEEPLALSPNDLHGCQIPHQISHHLLTTG